MPNTEPDPDQLWLQIREAEKADRPATVVRLCRVLVRHFPDKGVFWLTLGINLYGMARYQDAITAIRRAIRLFPERKREMALSHIGHLYKQWGKYRQAARWYRRAIEAEPDDATGYIFLGGVLARSGDLSAAEEVHRRATCCRDGCIDEAYLNLGLVLRAQERYAEAANCFRKAIELDPEYEIAIDALADVEHFLTLNPGEPSQDG